MALNRQPCSDCDACRSGLGRDERWNLSQNRGSALKTRRRCCEECGLRAENEHRSKRFGVSVTLMIHVIGDSKRLVSRAKGGAMTPNPLFSGGAAARLATKAWYRLPA